MRRRLPGLLVAGGLLLALAAAPAVADPKKGEAIPLVCDNGQSYTVITNGNGDFTPGHIVGSTSMLIPVAFGEFTGTVTDAEGNVVERFTEPGTSKGQSARKARDTITCTFTFSGTEGGMTFQGSGSVVAFLTPRGRS